MCMTKYILDLTIPNIVHFLLENYFFFVCSQHMMVRDKPVSEWVSKLNVLISHNRCTGDLFSLQSAFSNKTQNKTKQRNKERKKQTNKNKNKRIATTTTTKQKQKHINGLLSGAPLCALV